MKISLYLVDVVGLSLLGVLTSSLAPVANSIAINDGKNYKCLF